MRAELLNQIQELVGQAGAETVRLVLESTTISGHSRGSMVVGIVTLLFGATTVFVQLQSALNQIWDVETPVKTLIMFFGAEITVVYAEHRRRRVRPTEHAVTVDR